jgi:hypothetical protein
MGYSEMKKPKNNIPALKIKWTYRRWGPVLGSELPTPLQNLTFTGMKGIEGTWQFIGRTKKGHWKLRRLLPK